MFNFYGTGEKGDPGREGIAGMNGIPGPPGHVFLLPVKSLAILTFNKTKYNKINLQALHKCNAQRRALKMLQ